MHCLNSTELLNGDGNKNQYVTTMACFKTYSKWVIKVYEERS